MPDAYWTWIWPATKKAEELIIKYNIKIFYTTANPNSILQIGINLKKKFKDIKWIADFRDPVGYTKRYRTPNTFFVNYEKNMIQSAMNKADVITGLANSYEKIFQKLYNIDNKKFYFIPTGLDEEYLLNYDLEENNNKKNYENYLLFSGEFLIEYGDYFFELFSELVNKESFNDLKIKFIGRREINEPLVRKIINKYKDLDKNIEFIDHLNQKELYKLIKNAKACLLAAGFNARWYCNYAKMVDYIALKKPIITVIPYHSEARKEIDKVGLGLHLTGIKNKDIIMLKQFLNNNISLSPSDYYKNYLSSIQVKNFVKIFDEILGVKNEI
jgi:hypothetical protein